MSSPIEIKLDNGSPPWPIDAGLRGGARRHSHGADAASSIEWWEAYHRSNQWLADGDYVRFREEALKSIPVLIVTERVNVRSHGLIDVDSQRRVKFLGYSRDFRQSQVIWLHHDGDDGDGHAELDATRRLLVNQFPIADSALGVLFGLSRIIERKFNIVKRRQVAIIQQSDTMPIGCDRQLDVLLAKIRQDRFELRMQAVFTGAEIHGPHRQPFHDGFHLIERQTIGAGRIAVTECAGEIALICKAKPERNRGVWGFQFRGRRRDLHRNLRHDAFSSHAAANIARKAPNVNSRMPLGKIICELLAKSVGYTLTAGEKAGTGNL